VNPLQVQRCVPVDVDRVGLSLKVAHQQEAHDLLVAETGAQVQGYMVFIVHSVH